MPSANSVVQELFLVTLPVAVEARLPAKFVAAVLSAADVTTAQPPVAGAAYVPPLHESCWNPYMPGAHTLRQFSKPVTQEVAVLPDLAELDPVHRTSVVRVAPPTWSTRAWLSDGL